MTDTDENVVEPDVTGFGNPSLNSDPIDEDTSNQIDSLLDEAIINSHFASVSRNFLTIVFREW